MTPREQTVLEEYLKATRRIQADGSDETRREFVTRPARSQGRAGHSLAARSADALCRRLGPQGRPRLWAHGSKRAAVQQLADVGLAPVVLSQATGTAETEAALTMLERVPTARGSRSGPTRGTTRGSS